MTVHKGQDVSYGVADRTAKFCVLQATTAVAVLPELAHANADHFGSFAFGQPTLMRTCYFLSGKGGDVFHKAILDEADFELTALST